MSNLPLAAQLEKYEKVRKLKRSNRRRRKIICVLERGFSLFWKTADKKSIAD
jgi:hypothetical protein